MLPSVAGKERHKALRSERSLNNGLRALVLCVASRKGGSDGARLEIFGPNTKDRSGLGRPDKFRQVFFRFSRSGRLIRAEMVAIWPRPTIISLLGVEFFTSLSSRC